MRDDDDDADKLFFVAWLTYESALVIFRAGAILRGEVRFVTAHSRNLEVVVVITLILWDKTSYPLCNLQLQKYSVLAIAL